MCSFAKGVTGAYVPLSGVAARSEIYDHFRTNPLGIGSTFYAHPICMAVAYAAVKHQLETKLIDNVIANEPVIEEEMEKLTAKHKCVKGGRVFGMAAGFDMIDKHGNFICQTHEPPPPIIRRSFLEEGLITIVKAHFVHCTPPLVATPDEIRWGFATLSRALDKVDKWIEEQP